MIKIQLQVNINKIAFNIVYYPIIIYNLYNIIFI